MPDRATRLLLIRHGETDWNVDARLQGHTDIVLNARGRQQADALAAALAGETVDAIYSSDLQRASATAAPLAAVLGLPLRLERGLRERGFGSYEGSTRDELLARDPDGARRWIDREPGFRAPGGESLEDFYQRVTTTVLGLAAAHPGQALALVSHGGALDCVWRYATGQPLHQARTCALPNAGVNRVLVSDGRMVLTGWNDTSHLDASRDEAC